VLLALTTSALVVQPVLARGGSYTFSGGTPGEQAAVRSALGASSFDWSLIPRPVTVHIARGRDSYSTDGNLYLDASLLDSGRFAWGIVQHEFAHQIDFMLLDDANRASLLTALGGNDWCDSVDGLAHSDHGCERFASELAWAYWPSPDNSLRPSSTRDEAGAMPVASFRALLAELLGVPTLAAAPPLGSPFALARATPKHR
jgi:hypothetical protein